MLLHSYADDTQIYITIKKQDCFADKVSDVEDCVSEIKLWMERNILKLNDDKTEFIVFKSNRNVELFTRESIQVGCITAVEISLKILELYLTSPYCNVLLHGLPDSTLNILQRVQNYPARIVTRIVTLLYT